MNSSVELQVISKIILSDDVNEVETLCSYDESYYAVCKPHIEFILNHKEKYGKVPDEFTFVAEFPNIELVPVSESLQFLEDGLRKNKQRILFLETYNKLADLGSGDIVDAWRYLEKQCDKAEMLNTVKPMDIVKDAEKRADEIVDFNKQKRIPTGFKEIDKVMYGGLSTVEELMLIIARTNTGKAQPLWSKVLTPTGWKSMRDIKLGDTVVGKNNDNGRVVEIFPQGMKDYYKVNFSDGTYVECCDDHLWEVLDRSGRRRDSKTYEQFQVLTTRELRESLGKKYSVDISTPIEFDVPFDRDNELDGYLLGVILGDGCLRKNTIMITNGDKEIWDRITPVVDSYDCQFTGKSHNSITGKVFGNNFVRRKVVEYGLMDKLSVDKHIPKQFFTAPIDVRLSLLAGLMDTDGWAIPNSPRWEFCTASRQLADDFVELTRSLGVYTKMHEERPSWYTKNGQKVQGHGKIVISCRSLFNPFYLSRKANLYQFRENVVNRSALRRNCKMIKSIELVGQTECQCLLLDNASHTYITDNYTVTHNTWVTTKMMESAQRNGFPVLYYSPEMQSSFIGTRFDTWRGHFKNSDLHKGNYSEDYKQYLKTLVSEETGAIVVEDKDMPEGRTTVRGLEQLVKKNKIKLLIIDGLSYISSDGGKNDTDVVRYKNICSDLFRLSKTYGCAVVVSVQANRATKENNDDKGEPFPTIYNIEGSDHPARIATQVFALRQIHDTHTMEIRLEKSRNAKNDKPVFSYVWDPNTGTTSLIADNDNDVSSSSEFHTPVITPNTKVEITENAVDVDYDEDIVF